MEVEQTQVEDTSLEAIRAILRDIAKSQEETTKKMKETDRKMEENARQMRETDRKMEETARQMKETDRKISKLGGRFGEMVEYMVMPNLLVKFDELGFDFEKAFHSTTIRDTKNNIITEVDVTLENGDKVMIVEVKTKPDIGDIMEHLERMKKIRSYADLHNDKRKFLGAIAGMVINENVRNFALKNGFYLIEPSGETFIITEPGGDYSPREW